MLSRVKFFNGGIDCCVELTGLENKLYENGKILLFRDLMQGVN